MQSRRISSGTEEHPNPKDAIRALLSRMIERGIESSWTHIEVVAEGGWFKNLLHGKEPWIEVACVDEESLQLNLGHFQPDGFGIPVIPEKWRGEGKGLWRVPNADTEALLDWIDTCLTARSGRQDYQVSGWIAGL